MPIAQTSHLRHVGDVKSISDLKNTIAACFQTKHVFYFGFFKHCSDACLAILNTHPNIRSILVTNDKKKRIDSNVYFVKISSTQLVYEEETEEALIRFVYDIQKDELFLNKSHVYNPQTKQRFMKKIQNVGADLNTNQAFVFDA